MDLFVSRRKASVVISFLVIIIIGITSHWDQQPLLSNNPSMEIVSFRDFPKIQKIPSRDKASMIINESNRAEIWTKLEAKLQQQEKSRRFPKIILIGVKKCGTGALLDFLGSHPLVRKFPGEVHFFDVVEESENESLEYLNLFDPVEEDVFLMEKTPAYFRSAKMNIAFRLKKTVPNAKFLVLLCEPTRRALSDFFANKARYESKIQKYENISRYSTLDDFLKTYYPIFKEEMKSYTPEWSSEKCLQKQKRLFDLFDEDPVPGILTNGFYSLILQEWWQYFNESNLLILNGEEMYNNLGEMIERIQEFVGLPKVLLNSDFVKDSETGFYCYKNWKKNNTLRCLTSRQRTRNGKQSITESASKQLEDLYKPFNEALFSFMGDRFNW